MRRRRMSGKTYGPTYAVTSRSSGSASPDSAAERIVRHGPATLPGPGRPQLVVAGAQVLGQHPDLGDRGHEVRVAAPAREHVHVQVGRARRRRRPARCSRRGSRRRASTRPRIARNARTCARESATSSSSSRSSRLGDVTGRRDHQVPGPVRVEVHHGDRLRRALQHERLARRRSRRRGCTSRTRCRCGPCSGPTRSRPPARPEPFEAHAIAHAASRGVRRLRRRAARRTRRPARRARRSLAAAPVHADRAVLDVGVADHEHVRHLLGLGPADARVQRAVRAVEHLGAEPVGLQPRRDLVRVVVVAVGDRAAPSPAPARATPGTRPRSARRGSRRTARSSRTARGGS